MARWGFVDTRTGRSFGIEAYPNREYAQMVLDGYKARDRRGGRPDLHDVMPHVELREVSGPVNPLADAR